MSFTEIDKSEIELIRSVDKNVDLTSPKIIQH